jgi:hypothetical protein
MPADRRAQVGDYVLGQQTGGQREATREYLAASPAAAAWARATADALRPLGGELPSIPDEAPAQAAEALGPEPAVTEPAVGAGAPTLEASTHAPAAEPAPSVAAPPRTSRLGGALLIGGVGVLVAVALVLILSGGDEGKKAKSAASPATQSTAGQPTPVAQINLMAASGGKSVGLAQVFVQGNQRLLIAAAQSLTPGNYAIWLYTSSAKARLLGFVPQRVDKTGRFVTQGVLPDDARTFESLVVTREQVTRGKVPTTPGAIVLRGKLQTG